MTAFMKEVGEWLGGESAGVFLSATAKTGATGVVLQFGEPGEEDSVKDLFDAAFKRMKKEGGGAGTEAWIAGYTVWASGGAEGSACKETESEGMSRALDELRDARAATQRKVGELIGMEEFSVEVMEKMRAECKKEWTAQRKESQAELSELSETLRMTRLKVDELLGEGTVFNGLECQEDALARSMAPPPSMGKPRHTENWSGGGGGGKGGGGTGGAAGGARTSFVYVKDRACYFCNELGHEHRNCRGGMRGQTRPSSQWGTKGK